MTIYECRFLCIQIVACNFIIEILCVFHDFINNNNKNREILFLVYWRFFEYVVNGCGSWFLVKGAPLIIEYLYLVSSKWPNIGKIKFILHIIYKR